MEKFAEKAIELCTAAAGKIILALLVYIIGKFIVKKLVKMIEKMKAFEKVDTTARSYILAVIKGTLYAILFISIIGILGVPMASVVAVLASCALAVGMALQGALSNFAGGIMLLIFRPFSVGDYIIASGEEGVVKEISLIYTVLTTLDNKTVSIPNGALMNASIENLSAEDKRRVDLSFNITGDKPIDEVKKVLSDTVAKTGKALTDPAPQIEPLTGIAGGLTYTVRVWTKNEDYWDVYFALMNDIPTALGEAGIGGPVPSMNITK